MWERAVSLCCRSPRCRPPGVLQIENGVELTAGPSVLPWPDLESAEQKAIQGLSRNSPRDLNANKNKFCPVKLLNKSQAWKMTATPVRAVLCDKVVFCTLAPQFLLLHTKMPSEKMNSCSSWERDVARWDLVLFCPARGSFPRSEWKM